MAKQERRLGYGELAAAQTQPRGLIPLALATLVGMVLRGWGFFDIGLSHFDEGIYALSGLWPWTGTFESSQGYYSPAAFPWLVGFAYQLFGAPIDSAVIAVSFFFGVATIPLVWWIANSWWDHRVAGIASWLVAVDGMSIAFSRVGLTDAMFTFLFLLSIQFIVRALPNGPWPRVVIAGAAVGFTWNTKYNGFLPALVCLGFVVGPEWKRALPRLVLIGLVAAICYAPWAWSFHVKHGYWSLIEHQRGYVQGVTAMPGNWPRAWGDWNLMCTATGGLVLLIAGIRGRRWLLGIAGLALAASGGNLLLWLILAVVGVAMSPRYRWPAYGWMLGIMLLLPAIYTPYFRLWLPTANLLLLFAAAGAVLLADRLEILAVTAPWKSRLTSAGSLVIAGSVAFALGALPNYNPLPESAEGYRTATARLAHLCEERDKKVVALVRPPALLYLGSRGVSVRRLAGDRYDPKDVQPGEALVFDHAIADSPKFLVEFDRVHPGDESTPTQTFEVHPSLITLLDDYAPDELPEDNDRYSLRVYVPRD